MGIKNRGEKKQQDFQSITQAASGLSDDLPGRQKKYFISMMVRTACFLLAVFTPSPYRWFFLVGAVVLPYISVIVANGGRETIRGQAKILGNTRELN
ncbi:MAG: DUF3099 domain-containing protein [Candidatus Nanopelagicaceae bacterium]|nr:DUF3099 domain-containing protein [Candidatus Nanopelagicaceae bacterium]